jgi:hypothetical protein
MDAHFIGTLLGYWFCLWLSFKLISGGNPLLAIIGVLWLFGTLKTIFSNIMDLFAISFHWVDIVIRNVSNIFASYM